MSQPPYPGQTPGEGQQWPPPGTPYPQQPWTPGGPAAADPLISADYNGWWQRSIGIVKTYWRQLLVLQAIGAAVGFLLRIPEAVLQATVTRDVLGTGTG